MKTLLLDRSGILFSVACIIHCLALPLLATATPLFGALAENEDIHRVLALVTALVAILAFARPIPNMKLSGLRLMAGIGVALLICGAFVEALHDFETPLTLIGALLLVAAHFLRARQLRQNIEGHLSKV